MFSLICLLACETELPPEGSLDPEECSDGFDNDQDGLVDCHDPDCESIRVDCDQDTDRPDPDDTGRRDTGEGDTDTDVDADTDVDTDPGDTAVLEFGHRGEVDASFTGLYEIWVERAWGEEVCTYTWDTQGLETIACEDCAFAWTVGFSDGRSNTLETCERVFGELGQGFYLDDAGVGFSYSISYYGEVLEDVVVYHHDGRWVPWAYGSYEEGVLSWKLSYGTTYYYY